MASESVQDGATAVNEKQDMSMASESVQDRGVVVKARIQDRPVEQLAEILEENRFEVSQFYDKDATAPLIQFFADDEEAATRAVELAFQHGFIVRVLGWDRDCTISDEGRGVRNWSLGLPSYYLILAP